MRIPLAHDTYSSLTLSTNHIERVFWIDLISRWNKLVAASIRTKHSRFPWRAELQNGFQKGMLLLTCEDGLDCSARYGLSAASRRHLGLIIDRLTDHDM